MENSPISLAETPFHLSVYHSIVRTRKLPDEIVKLNREQSFFSVGVKRNTIVSASTVRSQRSKACVNKE